MKNEYKEEKTVLGTKITHPSYGTMVFNRSHGGETSLFGSSIKHCDTITMNLYHAGITRSLHQDWIHGDDAIARVEMSYSQFAEAITSFGQGSGVPVTIRYTELDGRIPSCDFVDKRQQFVQEVDEKINEAMATSQELLNDIANLFSNKKTFTKADRETVLSKLQVLSNDIGTNLSFIAEMFNEQMDKTVCEAKGEIEAFCQNKINAIATTALVENRDEILKFDNPVDIETDRSI